MNRKNMSVSRIYLHPYREFLYEVGGGMQGLRYRELPKYIIDYVFCGRWSVNERKVVAAFMYGNNVSLYIYIYIIRWLLIAETCCCKLFKMIINSSFLDYLILIFY